ncbi:MAG: signal peptidase II [Acutalibacteraceae bacterium]|nr:signal peptidase II [Acutalibacteraceae bacterium]
MSVIISLISIAVLTAADQVIKLFVERFLAPVGTAEFINGFIGWNYVRNTGAAFGSFSDNTVLLSVVTGAVLLAGIVLIAMKKVKSRFCLVCAVMIISGGLGNLIDRVLKGYVVDFIDLQFMNFAVFNFADILVTVGAFALMLYVIADIFRDRKNSGEKNE